MTASAGDTKTIAVRTAITEALDEALAADALIRLGPPEAGGQAPDPGLPARRDELFRRLGLVAVPAPGP